jgi:hypothetical protein
VLKVEDSMLLRIDVGALQRLRVKDVLDKYYVRAFPKAMWSEYCHDKSCDEAKATLSE